MSLNIKNIKDCSILFSSLPKTNKNAIFNNVNIGDLAKLKDKNFKHLLRKNYEEYEDSILKDAKDIASNIELPTKNGKTSKDYQDTQNISNNLFKSLNSIDSSDNIDKNTIKDFVQNYNDMKDFVKNNSSLNILTTGIDTLSKKNLLDLGKIGISIDDNGYMSINDDILNSSSSKDIRQAFVKNGYISQLKSTTKKLPSIVEKGLISQNTYNSKASMNKISSGFLFDDFT